MRPAERLSIVAMGVVCALGDGCDQSFARLVEGEVRHAPPPFALPFETVTGIIEGPLDALPGAHRGYDTRLSRIALRALPQVTTAIERLKARFGNERIAVLIGTSTGGLDTTERVYRNYRETQARTPGWSLRHAHSFDATGALVSEVLGLRGPSYSVSTACTSSAKALASARRLITGGVVDAVLVIGVDALTETTLRGFHALGVLSQRSARPFSAARDGIHIGEGAALLLLARDSEGPVQLAGVGESSDAYSMSAPHPEGLGAAAAMTSALRAAGLDAAQVDYVNAHGTGTLQNDVAEAAAIARVFSRDVPVSSTKGATGHTLGACGALEALICAQAIIRGVMPPNAGVTPRDPAIDLNLLQQAVRRPVRVAVSNALAFGGSNASVVLTAS